MRVGDKWQRVEVVDEKTKEEYVEWEGGGGGERYQEQLWILHCDCGNDFEVLKKGFRKKEHKDCGCGLAGQDGRKVLAGPYTVPQSTLDAINKYAQTHTSGNVSHAVTLMVRRVVENNVDVESTQSSTQSTWSEAEVGDAKR